MLNASRTEKWSTVPDKTNPLQIPLRKRETMFDQEKSWSKRRDRNGISFLLAVTEAVLHWEAKSAAVQGGH